MTFKVSPLRYTQIMNIVCYDNLTGNWFPSLYAFLTNKAQSSYEVIFDFIREYFKKQAISAKVNVILCDFEKSLHNALTGRFKMKIIGCYFHFVKALWMKAGRFGLKTKDNIENMKIIIDKLKILSHLPYDVRLDFLNIIQIQNSKIFENCKFNDFIKYFKKNYLDHTARFCNLLNYNLDFFDIEKNLYIRANNVVEGYNNRSLFIIVCF